MSRDPHCSSLTWGRGRATEWVLSSIPLPQQPAVWGSGDFPQQPAVSYLVYLNFTASKI